MFLQFIEPVAGTAVDEQVTDLDHHTAQEPRGDGHLEVDRVAGQHAQGLAQLAALVLAHVGGGLDPRHPPAPGPGGVLDQGVEGGHDVAGPTAPHGVGGQFFSLRGRPRPAGLRLPDRYVLHVGSQRPHKNQRVLVEAMAALRAGHPGLGLVLVGQPDPRCPDETGKLVRALGLSDLVYRHTRVADDALLDLYANADVFAYPSLAEGFGMPVLEAMAAGLPVVASDAEAVQEVAAGAALIVPARATAAWVQALDRVLTDPQLGRDLRERGQAVAARHTWARSAERTLSFLTATARLGVTAGDGATVGEHSA